MSPTTSPEPEAYRRVDVFLSYNSRDRAAALALKQTLEGQGLRTFFDLDSLRPGLPWQDDLAAAITGCRIMAVLLGAHGLGVWQKRELACALDRQAMEEKADRAFPVVPLFLPGVDRAAAPPFLLLNHGLDLDTDDSHGAAVELLQRLAGGAAPDPAARPVSPYRGLRAFREEDAPFFFGRDPFAERLLDKVRKFPLVAVVGASGSGKSSVVHAGLLPRLRREPRSGGAWEAVTFRPGRRPFHQLAAALLGLIEPDRASLVIRAEELGGQLAANRELDLAVDQAIRATPGTDRLLVVVDQLEELFTLSAAADQLPFIDMLLRAADGRKVTVVVTLRADFYSVAVSASRALSDRVEEGLINLGPMTVDEMRQAIEGPARRAGLRPQSGLVELILKEVDEQAGSLPLVEFTLAELYERAADSELRLTDYKALDGVRGAVRRRADDVLGALSPAQRKRAQRLFGRLVRVAEAGAEGADTRQRVPLAELDAVTRTVAEKFIEARLLVVSPGAVSGQEVLEVAHEALIRHWPTLREWLQQDRELLAWAQAVNRAGDVWEWTGRDTGQLWTGRALKALSRRAKTEGDRLNTVGRAFVHASEAERRKDRRQTIVAGFVAVVLFIGSITGYVWWTDRPQYQAAQAVARVAELRINVKPMTARRWTRALVISDRLNEARAAAELWQEPTLRSVALAGIAEGLALRDERDEAARVAQEATDTLPPAAKLPPPTHGPDQLARIYARTTVPSVAPALVAAALIRCGETQRGNELAERRLVLDLKPEERIAYVALTAFALAESGHVDLASALVNRQFYDRQYQYFVRFLVQSGKTEEALRFVRGAGQRHKILTLARVLRRENQPDGLTALATQTADMIEKNEQQLDALDLLGGLVRVLALAGQRDHAKALAQRLEAKVPEHPPEFNRHREARRLVDIAGVYLDLDDHDAARRVVARAEAAAKPVQPYVRLNHDVFDDAAIVRVRLGDLELAWTVAAKGGYGSVYYGSLKGYRRLVDRLCFEERLLPQAEATAREMAKQYVYDGMGVLAGELARDWQLIQARRLAEDIADVYVASRAWSQIAIMLARARLFSSASQTAERAVFPDDRIVAYAEIVLEEALLRHPELAERIKSLRLSDDLLSHN
jgi:hypothetical protein